MLQVTVTNNIRIRGASVPLRAAITLALTMDNPAYKAKKVRKLPTWGIAPRLELYNYDVDGTLVTGRGFMGELLEILRKQGITPEKVITYAYNELPPVTFGAWNPAYEIGAPPRGYQTDATAAGIKHGGVLVSPAGSGKTAMGWYIVSWWQQPALWLVHTIDLMNQAKEAAEKYLPGAGRVGLIGGGKLDWGDGKLFVAVVDTLESQPRLVDTLRGMVGTLVIDEAHHFPAPKFLNVAGQFATKNLLGLTATPNRKDGLERFMYVGIGPMCYEVQRDGLYDAGSLIKPEIKFVYTDFKGGSQAEDQPVEKNVNGGGDELDYRALLNDLMADDARAKLVAENILEGCIAAAPKGGASIVITESVRYCFVLRDLVAKFAQVRLGGNVPRMAVVHGGMQRYKWLTAKNERAAAWAVQQGRATEYRNHQGNWQMKVENYTLQEMTDWQVTPTRRELIMADAKARKIDILFATQLAREGLDIPHLSVGHLAMPKRGDGRETANGGSVEQEIGRIQRPDPQNPGKTATWYDYVDYFVGVFQDQYYSRRKVYSRLGLSVPKKPRTETDELKDWLKSGAMFGGLPL